MGGRTGCRVELRFRYPLVADIEKVGDIWMMLGAPGSGKNAIIRHACLSNGFHNVCSTTTRPLRREERQEFKSEYERIGKRLFRSYLRGDQAKELERKRRYHENRFLDEPVPDNHFAWALNVFGHYYGTRTDSFRYAWTTPGVHFIHAAFETITDAIEWAFFSHRSLNVVFIEPPARAVLRERILSRDSTIDHDELEHRLDICDEWSGRARRVDEKCRVKLHRLKNDGTIDEAVVRLKEVISSAQAHGLGMSPKRQVPAVA